MASSRFSMRRRTKAPLGADRGEGGRDPPALRREGNKLPGDRPLTGALAQQRPESDRRPVRRQHSAPDDARAARATRQAARPLGRAVGGHGEGLHHRGEGRSSARASHLPFAGALVVLPVLAAGRVLSMLPRRSTGSERHIGGTAAAAFYGIRALMLSIVFACLLGRSHGPRG